MSPEYAPTPQTTPTRYRDRMRYDAETVHAILDDAFLAHVSFAAGGLPQVLPLIYGRDGSRVYVHASSGSHLALAVRGAGAAGLPVAFAVTHADALVLARSAMHHSLNYRSVVAHGPLVQVDDPAERLHGFDVIVDHMLAGRSADCREPDAKELAQTGLFALDLDAVAGRVRAHGVADDERDLELPYWAGVVPLRTAASAPRPEGDLADGIAVPEYLAAWAAARA